MGRFSLFVAVARKRCCQQHDLGREPAHHDRRLRFFASAICPCPQPMSSSTTHRTGSFARPRFHLSLPSQDRRVAPSGLANGGCGEQRLQDIARTTAAERGVGVDVDLAKIGFGPPAAGTMYEGHTCPNLDGPT